MKHVVENEMMQDEIAVLSIIEAVFGEISRTTPLIKEMTIRKQNATKYNNS